MKYAYKRCCYTGMVVLMLVSLSCCQKDPLNDREEYVSDFTAGVSPDSLGSYIGWLEGMGTRFALAPNHRDVAVQIRNRLRSMGYLDASLDSFFLTRVFQEITYTTWQYNVIATVEGWEPDSISIVGAHYDDYVSGADPFTEAPGANDNASGVAAVMEIARLVKKNRFLPEHTIRFVLFAAEELGLHGSADYATKVAMAGEKVKMMINHDMIAYLPDPGANPWYVNIIHYDNSIWLRERAAKLCAANTSLVAFSDNTSYKRSDSYPFFVAHYKALFYNQSHIESTYHTTGDILSVCNLEYCAEIVKASCALVVHKNYRKQ